MANNPELLKMPLARDGQKSTIPETTDASTGLFSQQYGWQSINSLPPQAGGKAVKREDFNGAFNLLGGVAFMAQKGFTFKWSAEQDYYAGCVVIDDTDGLRYECIADVIANSTTPSADSTHWQIFKAGTDIDAWFRQPSTQYSNGAIALLLTLPTGWYLECTGTGGVTSANDLVITSPAVGGTVTDGAVVWTIRKLTMVEIPNASSTVAGIMKLYSSKGTNTDGAMTQQAITNELGNLESLIGSAETHNAIYRGKDLTEYFSSGQMSTDLANGNFSNIFVGDYITKTVTIDGVTYDNVKWVVMHINYHLHEGGTETTQNHVVLMPEERLGTRQMNGSNTTAGGYTGSAMWTAHIPKVVTGIENAFGAEHVLEHRELLTNAMDRNQRSSAYYGWSGASSNWIWVSVKANLANEAMVYGAPVMSSSAYDTGECNTQLAAFKLNHGLICSKRYWWWLRSIADSTDFCGVSDHGNASHHDASISDAGVRPYFLLY